MTRTIHAPRLDLVPWGTEAMEAFIAGEYERAGRLGGFTVPPDLGLSRLAVERRLRQMRADPTLAPWLLHGIVVRETRTLCGRISFHTRPGPAELRDVAADGVELGYEVGAAFRRRGYAKEAALALMKWAFDTHGQRCFVLTVGTENAASLAMTRALGFAEAGTHMDAVDGPELYFVRRLAEWPEEWGAGYSCTS